jgi:hypothetical protein
MRLAGHKCLLRRIPIAAAFGVNLSDFASKRVQNGIFRGFESIFKPKLTAGFKRVVGQ